MKKILVLLLACMLSAIVSAQEHLTFKGIPIDGKLTAFISKLKAQGFQELGVVDNFALLKGDFGGEKCEIAIYASKNTNIVYQAVVILEESNSWASLKSTYREYKSLLKSKYGSGESYEDFSSPYYEGDGYEMTAIRCNKCTYFTKFNTYNGKISLHIGNISSGAAVVLYYEDKINNEIATREESSQRINDL